MEELLFMMIKEPAREERNEGDKRRDGEIEEAGRIGERRLAKWAKVYSVALSTSHIPSTSPFLAL